MGQEQSRHGGSKDKSEETKKTSGGASGGGSKATDNLVLNTITTPLPLYGFNHPFFLPHRENNQAVYNYEDLKLYYALFYKDCEAFSPSEYFRGVTQYFAHTPYINPILNSATEPYVLNTLYQFLIGGGGGYDKTNGYITTKKDESINMSAGQRVHYHTDPHHDVDYGDIAVEGEGEVEKYMFQQVFANPLLLAQQQQQQQQQQHSTSQHPTQLKTHPATSLLFEKYNAKPAHHQVNNTEYLHHFVQQQKVYHKYGTTPPRFTMQLLLQHNIPQYTSVVNEIDHPSLIATAQSFSSPNPAQQDHKQQQKPQQMIIDANINKTTHMLNTNTVLDARKSTQLDDNEDYLLIEAEGNNVKHYPISSTLPPRTQSLTNNTTPTQSPTNNNNNNTSPACSVDSCSTTRTTTTTTIMKRTKDTLFAYQYPHHHQTNPHQIHRTAPTSMLPHTSPQPSSPNAPSHTHVLQKLVTNPTPTPMVLIYINDLNQYTVDSFHLFLQHYKNSLTMLQALDYLPEVVILFDMQHYDTCDTTLITKEEIGTLMGQAGVLGENFTIYDVLLNSPQAILATAQLVDNVLLHVFQSKLLPYLAQIQEFKMEDRGDGHHNNHHDKKKTHISSTTTTPPTTHQNYHNIDKSAIAHEEMNLIYDLLSNTPHTIVKGAFSHHVDESSFEYRYKTLMQALTQYLNNHQSTQQAASPATLAQTIMQFNVMVEKKMHTITKKYHIAPPCYFSLLNPAYTKILLLKQYSGLKLTPQSTDHGDTYHDLLYYYWRKKLCNQLLITTFLSRARITTLPQRQKKQSSGKVMQIPTPMESVERVVVSFMNHSIHLLSFEPNEQESGMCRSYTRRQRLRQRLKVKNNNSNSSLSSPRSSNSNPQSALQGENHSTNHLALFKSDSAHLYINPHEHADKKSIIKKSEGPVSPQLPTSFSTPQQQQQHQQQQQLQQQPPPRITTTVSSTNPTDVVVNPSLDVQSIDTQSLSVKTKKSVTFQPEDRLVVQRLLLPHKSENSGDDDGSAHSGNKDETDDSSSGMETGDEDDEVAFSNTHHNPNLVEQHAKTRNNSKTYYPRAANRYGELLGRGDLASCNDMHPLTCFTTQFTSLYQVFTLSTLNSAAQQIRLNTLPYHHNTHGGHSIYQHYRQRGGAAGSTASGSNNNSSGEQRPMSQHQPGDIMLHASDDFIEVLHQSPHPNTIHVSLHETLFEEGGDKTLSTGGSGGGSNMYNIQSDSPHPPPQQTAQHFSNTSLFVASIVAQSPPYSGTPTVTTPPQHTQTSQYPTPIATDGISTSSSSDTSNPNKTIKGHDEHATSFLQQLQLHRANSGTTVSTGVSTHQDLHMAQEPINTHLNHPQPVQNRPQVSASLNSFDFKSTHHRAPPSSSPVHQTAGLGKNKKPSPQHNEEHSEMTIVDDYCCVPSVLVTRNIPHHTMPLPVLVVLRYNMLVNRYALIDQHPQTAESAMQMAKILREGFIFYNLLLPYIYTLQQYKAYLSHNNDSPYPFSYIPPHSSHHQAHLNHFLHRYNYHKFFQTFAPQYPTTQYFIHPRSKYNSSQCLLGMYHPDLKKKKTGGGLLQFLKNEKADTPAPVQQPVVGADADIVSQAYLDKEVSLSNPKSHSVISGFATNTTKTNNEKYIQPNNSQISSHRPTSPACPKLLPAPMIIVNSMTNNANNPKDDQISALQSFIQQEYDRKSSAVSTTGSDSNPLSHIVRTLGHLHHTFHPQKNSTTTLPILPHNSSNHLQDVPVDNTAIATPLQHPQQQEQQQQQKSSTQALTLVVDDINIAPPQQAQATTPSMPQTTLCNTANKTYYILAQTMVSTISAPDVLFLQRCASKLRKFYTPILQQLIEHNPFALMNIVHIIDLSVPGGCFHRDTNKIARKTLNQKKQNNIVTEHTHQLEQLDEVHFSSIFSPLYSTLPFVDIIPHFFLIITSCQNEQFAEGASNSPYGEDMNEKNMDNIALQNAHALHTVNSNYQKGLHNSVKKLKTTLDVMCEYIQEQLYPEKALLALKAQNNKTPPNNNNNNDNHVNTHPQNHAADHNTTDPTPSSTSSVVSSATSKPSNNHYFDQIHFITLNSPTLYQYQLVLTHIYHQSIAMKLEVIYKQQEQRSSQKLPTPSKSPV